MRAEDFGALVPLCIGIQSVMWPKDNNDPCLRALQFMTFELQKSCENKTEAERWETLRDFIFNERVFSWPLNAPKNSAKMWLLMRSVLQERVGHPLTVVFVLLHLAHFLDLPMALIPSPPSLFTQVGPFGQNRLHGPLQ